MEVTDITAHIYLNILSFFCGQWIVNPFPDSFASTIFFLKSTLDLAMGIHSLKKSEANIAKPILL